MVGVILRVRVDATRDILVGGDCIRQCLHTRNARKVVSVQYVILHLDEARGHLRGRILIGLEAAIARELQGPAVLRDRPHNVVGSACGDLRFDFQSDAHR